MVPLVFKTSLGVVRSPEGSTPSLLRQGNRFNGSRQSLVWRSVEPPRKSQINAGPEFGTTKQHGSASENFEP